MRNALMFVGLFLGCAYDAGAGQLTPRGPEIGQKSALGQAGCDLDVQKTRASAERGNVAAARELKGYYLDCVKENNEATAEHWALVAARLGGRADEKEYMNILLEFRFERGEDEWKSPRSCARSEMQRAQGNDLKSVRKRLAVSVSCENKGISRNILSLAGRAAKVGGPEDVKFFDQIRSLKHKASD